MERNRAFDIMKGVGILSVILGHMDIEPYWRNVIYSFHMPLFFILAGYFFVRAIRSLKKLVKIRDDYALLMCLRWVFCSYI